MELGGESVAAAAAAGGLRKGAWTEDEDRLLRRCIQCYGEGRWHQVPIRAGLNRCRKSCRLRWLNYLKPNIKRGEFSDDEVDLMTRLHNLLGNRWSLIAGRLPGRTANDVKNYWNTHQKKKTAPFQSRAGYMNNGRPPAGAVAAKKKNNNSCIPPRLQITKTNIIKPRPRTFSSKSFSCWAKKPTEPKIIKIKPMFPNKPHNDIYKLPPNENNVSGGSTWVDQLERFLDVDCINNNRPAADIGGHQTETPLGQLMSSILPEHNKEKSSIHVMSFEQDDNYQSSWSDVDIWHLLSDQQDI